MVTRSVQGTRLLAAPVSVRRASGCTFNPACAAAPCAATHLLDVRVVAEDAGEAGSLHLSQLGGTEPRLPRPALVPEPVPSLQADELVTQQTLR